MKHSEDMEEETGATEAPLRNKKDIDFFPLIVHSLSEEELKSPAVLKMVISENENKEKEIKHLKEIEEKFHECDKNLAINQEKLKLKTSLEIFTDLVYTIGGLILAISTTDFQSGFKIHNIIFIVIGLVLIIGTAIAKWSRK